MPKFKGGSGVRSPRLTDKQIVSTVEGVLNEAEGLCTDVGMDLHGGLVSPREKAMYQLLMKIEDIVHFHSSSCCRTVDRDQWTIELYNRLVLEGYTSGKVCATRKEESSCRRQR